MILLAPETDTPNSPLMVRLSDLDPGSAKHLLDKGRLRDVAVGRGTARGGASVAIMTSAGLHCRDDQNLALRDLSYRVIPGDIDTAELVMTQSSVNYDRTAFSRT